MRDILLAMSLWSMLLAGTPRPPHDIVEINHCYNFGGEKQAHGRVYRETWTQWDPEMIDRDRLPPERRRGL